MADEIPAQLQEQVDQLQRLQSQFAVAQQQRQQIEFQIREIDRALEELNTVPEDAPVYRSVGSVLFKTAGKKEALARLKEEKESLEVRLRGFQKQEGRLREAAQELQSKVQAGLRVVQASPGKARPPSAKIGGGKTAS